MSSAVDAIYNNFNNADPAAAGGGGNKIAVAGDFLVKVDKHLIRESQKTTQVFFVCEYEVLESSVPEIPAGSKRSWTCDLTRKFGKDTYPGVNDTAAHLVACSGHDPTKGEVSVSKADLQEAVGEEQPFRGKLVRLQTVPKIAEGSGRPWTQAIWSPAE